MCIQLAFNSLYIRSGLIQSNNSACKYFNICASEIDISNFATNANSRRNLLFLFFPGNVYMLRIYDGPWQNVTRLARFESISQTVHAILCSIHFLVLFDSAQKWNVESYEWILICALVFRSHFTAKIYPMCVCLCRTNWWIFGDIRHLKTACVSISGNRLCLWFYHGNISGFFFMLLFRTQKYHYVWPNGSST